jgi:hypothetical protein
MAGKDLLQPQKNSYISEKLKVTFWMSRSILSLLKISEQMIDPNWIIEKKGDPVCIIIFPPLRLNCDF